MNHRIEVANHLTRIRISELNSVKHYFKPEIYVLEIGGGNGLQASVISEWGCNINSIDLESNKNKLNFYDVVSYDGVNFPFEAAKFDVIFTSNVLEHVLDINNILNELKRVMKSDGIAICIMPTPAWRFWSIISHYIYLFAAILKILLKGKFYLSEMMTLIPPPHGNFQTCFHEIYFYSKYKWKIIFRKNELEVIETYKTNIFCTGYAIFPKINLKIRKILSYILGSSGNIFIVKKCL
jgi:ubiquinone/menaquinone biosynthesis C-methylase UbiE